MVAEYLITSYPRRISLGIGAVILLTCGTFAWGQVQLLEGFEDISRVRVTGGRLVALNAPAAVTQGKQAVRMLTGVVIRSSIPPKAAEQFQWLKIDTMTLGSVPQLIKLRFSARGFRAHLYAYVQPGRDTLALPLSVVSAKAKARWPEEAVTLAVENAAAVALIVDNLRLEAASAPPAECTLIDFGPERQGVWPGFAPGDIHDQSVTWGGGNAISSGVAPLADPLGRDYIGPPLLDKVTDSIILASKQRNLAVWLWVTHYGWHGSQPVEYAVRVGGRSLLNRRLTRRQARGPEGLLIGIDGKWTPKWFDSQQADMFVSLLRFTNVAGKGIDLGNCQLAALATAPFSKRAAMEKYIKDVQSDLSRHRRQFVVGYVRRTQCGLAPESGEEEAGAMIFAPAPDSGYSADWSPGKADRIKVLRILAANGGRLLAPLAMAPLRGSPVTSASVTALRSKSRRTLGLEKGGLSVRFLQRVPHVRDAAVGFQPWVLLSKCPPLAPREVVFMVLTGRVRPDVRGGIYRGTLTISVSGRRSVLPVEIEIADLGAREFSRATIAGMGAVSGPDFYRGAAFMLPPAQRNQLTLGLRSQLLLDGLDALTLSGAYVNTNDRVSTVSYVASLKAYPVALAKAPTLLSVLNAGRRLVVATRGRVRNLRNAATGAIRKTVELGDKAGVSPSRSYLYWPAGNSINGDDRTVVAAIRAAGGRGAMLCGSNVIGSLDGRAARSRLRPWAALIISPTTRQVAGQVAAFKKMATDKKAYIYALRGDRYLCGFYPIAVGADGCYVGGLSVTYGMPYDGFHVYGAGVLAPTRDGALVPTLAMLRIWRGRDDADIMRRCEAILAKADKTSAPAQELAAVLDEIRGRAIGHNGVYYSSTIMRTNAVTPGELDVWREELLRAAAKLTAAAGN